MFPDFTDTTIAFTHCLCNDCQIEHWKLLQNWEWLWRLRKAKVEGSYCFLWKLLQPKSAFKTSRGQWRPKTTHLHSLQRGVACIIAFAYCLSNQSNWTLMRSAPPFTWMDRRILIKNNQDLKTFSPTSRKRMVFPGRCSRSPYFSSRQAYASSGDTRVLHFAPVLLGVSISES